LLQHSLFRKVALQTMTSTPANSNNNNDFDALMKQVFTQSQRELQEFQPVMDEHFHPSSETTEPSSNQHPKYGHQVTRRWKLSEDGENISVTYENDVKILISSRPLIQLSLDAESHSSTKFMYLNFNQLKLIIQGLWSMKKAGDDGNWNYNRIHEYDKNFNFIFTFEPLNLGANEMGLRIRYANKENKIVDQGIILSLKAVNTLRMWKNFILRHAEMLMTEACNFYKMIKLIARLVEQFPTVKNKVENIDRYVSFDHYQSEARSQVVQALNFIQKWDLKSSLVSEIKDSRLNVNSIYRNCMQNIDGILKEMGVTEGYYYYVLEKNCC
jgi:hypothetical protein